MRTPVFNKKRVILVVVLFAAVITAFFSNAHMRKLFSTSETSELKFQTGVDYDIVTYGNDLLLINHEGITALNRSGNEMWNIVFSMTTPMADVRDDYIMVADMNGKTVNLYEKDVLVSQIKTEKEIISAKVNKNGYIAVATDELGYRGLITVYDKSGNEVFKWHSGAGYIGDTDISDRNIIAVSQLMTDREKIYSRIVTLNVKSEEEKVLTDTIDGVVMDVEYRDNGEIVAVSDTEVCGFKKNGALKFRTDFRSRKLSGYDIGDEHNMVFAFLSGLNTTILESYSAKGELRGSFESHSKIETFDVSGEYILAASTGKVIRCNPKGELKFESEISHDIKKVGILPGRSKFIAIGDGVAKIIGLR